MPIIGGGGTLNGTAASELMVGDADAPGGPNDTIDGADGNDLILGDFEGYMSVNGAGANNTSVASAIAIDDDLLWSNSSYNPIINASGPHTSVYIEPDAGQQRYLAVTVGAGQTLTLDVDFAFGNFYNWGRGTQLDYVATALAVLDSGGTVLASSGYSGSTDNGSPEGWDSFLTFVAPTAGTYYIRVSELESDFSSHGAFEGGEQVLLNVSVTGHSATATPIAAGNDTINGGLGNDTILGMLGTDTVHGDTGNDLIYSTGNGSYYGGDGDDRIFAAGTTFGGSEILDGGANFDWLDTTTFAFNYVIDMVTGVTNYTASYGESFVNFERVSTGVGADTITGTAGYNNIQTGGGNDTVYAGDGNDSVSGGFGNDILYGEAGNDFLFDGYNSLANDIDTLDGGAGDDVIYYENGTQNGGGAHGGAGIDSLLIYNIADAGAVTVQLDGVTTSGAGTMATDGFENFTTYSLNNFTVIGTGGANTITTANGNDTLNGGGGADTMAGGLGNDMFYVDNAGDVVVEASGEGSDRVFASVSYALGAGVHVEILSTTNNAGTTAINLTGNELVNSIAGNNGSNVLNGGAGADTLNGLGGNDFFYVDNVGDVIVEAAGGGSDRVLASVSFALGVAAQVEILSTTNNAGVGAINLTGNGFANSIAGNNGANTLIGGAGADTLNGLGGNDMFYVDQFGDVVIEGTGGGSDRIFASSSYAMGAGVHVEILSTTNNAGLTSINLAGNELANSLAGNAGANVLDGGAGNDTLNGLGGADTFRFTTALGAGNVDTVTGYVVADDKIEIDNAVFTGLAAGALAAGAFRTGAAAADADDRIIYNSATGALLFDADGNGAGAAVQFATLSAGLAIAAGEFVVI